MNQKRNKATERGAVSLFVVVFSALLITVMSVSFIALMIQGQRQATTDDLSRSAYDSAQAGVEDAKRALVKYSEACASGDSVTCDRFTTAFANDKCSTIQDTGLVPAGEEVLIKQQEGDEALQQAYTCVKMKTNSPDYIGTLDSTTSRVVPLRGVEQFDRITFEWFMESDLQKGDTDGEVAVDLPSASDKTLPRLADWPKNRPALIRTQLIQFGTTFQLTDFDNNAGDKSNANTLFFYPNKAAGDGIDGVYKFIADARKSQTADTLRQVKCEENFTTNLYACKATIILPQAIGQNDNERTAYLRLNALYNSGNNFKVTLFNGPRQIDFAGVQAIVDSTGRANDQFRRVQSRVELDVSSFPYPEAAVDITGNLCKTFLVTDSEDDYSAETDKCDPTRYNSAP